MDDGPDRLVTADENTYLSDRSNYAEEIRQKVLTRATAY